MMHENSLHNYDTKILPTLRGRRLEVYSAIKKLGGIGCTLFEVAQLLDKPYHTLSGRLTELKKSGHIKDTGIRKLHHENYFSVYQII